MPDNNQQVNIQQDIQTVQEIPIIPSMLDSLCSTLGLGWAAISRVTENKWVACSVKDDLGYNLGPGDEIPFENTFCKDVRNSGQLVVMDDATTDEQYKDHPIPAMFGFRSYLSFPIVLPDGTFFGTLCGLDPEPRKMNNPTVRGMFKLYSELIAFHLQNHKETSKGNDPLNKDLPLKERLEAQKKFTRTLETKVISITQELVKQNIIMDRMREDLRKFTSISSHQLQEPLRKMQVISSLIEEKEAERLSPQSKHYFRRIKRSAQQMRDLVTALFTYSQMAFQQGHFKSTSLDDLLKTPLETLKEEIESKNAEVKIRSSIDLNVNQEQFQLLLELMLDNSLKFSHPERTPEIVVEGKGISHDFNSHSLRVHGKGYKHITIQDNGIGFDPNLGDELFKLFQTLPGSEQNGSGAGLAVVKKVVENHHGFIKAHGDPGKGAQFDIYIPA